MNNEYNKVGRCGKTIGDIFIITAAAVAAGLAIGFLFAPQSGLKTRKILNKSINEMIDRSKYALLEARVMSEELFEKSMEKAEEVSLKMKGKK